MSQCLAEQTVGSLVREQIGRSRVLERYGIDYCCGGDRPLAEACAVAGIAVQDVCNELTAAAAQPAGAEPDWSAARLTDLADHVEQRHHAYLRSELPRIARLIGRVVEAHGQRDPRLRAVQQVFAALQSELTLHMAKEEQILFPIIRQMEQSSTQGARVPQFHCGSVNNPIGVMQDEHRDAGVALATLRRLTAGYALPAGACETYRALLAALAELEADLHLHIHKENNILFPRAASLEADLFAKQR